MSIEEATKRLKDHHDQMSSPMRWGVFREKCYPQSAGCFGGLNDRPEGCDLVYTVFHGAGVELDLEACIHTPKFHEAMKASEKELLKFEGTESTLKWLQYLLDKDKSPWHDLIPFIHNLDPEEINNSGFIWTNFKKIPYKLFYNFLMAYRYPWEEPRNNSVRMHLVNSGMDETRALFISSNFVFSDKATGLEGPYKVIYPWSFLESGGLQSAGLFFSRKPDDLSASHRATPNVSSLWNRPLDGKYLKDLMVPEGRPLSYINQVLDEVVGVQTKGM